MMHMEYVSGNGIKLRDIFLDQGNWWKLFLLHRDLIRLSIIINVLTQLQQIRHKKGGKRAKIRQVKVVTH